MKKRLLSALLALALVFVLLPTTALADTTPVTDENVKINGTAVIVGNNISLGEGNGTYSYDKATHTLTLNSATINATGSNIGIEFCDTTNYVTYSVILTGENTVTSNNIAIETTPNTNLTFTGGGNLKAITNGYYQAIRVYGTLTIDNSTLIAESSAYTATTVIWTLAMTGNNAKLEISNKSAANIVAGTAGPASNIDWSNYQFTTGSYSGDALTESDPEVCSWGTLKKYFGYPTKEYSQYICIAKRTIPALTKTSDVLIAGKDAVVGVETSIPSANGSGTYYYDQASKTLTLNNVTITSGTNAIQFAAAGTYTVKLEGTNKISNVSNGISVTDDKYITSLNVTITGTGSLDISAKGLAINMKKGDLKFENTGEIKLTTSNISPTHNVLSVSGNITIADMEKYKVEGIVQDNTKDGGDTVTLSEASHLKGYQNPDGTAICLKTITITPTPAKDSTISYGKKTLKQGEIIKGEISGTATVATKGNTITLNNFKGNYPLEFNAEFTPNSITLIGDSTLSAVETKYQNLTISGSGSLTVGSIKVHNQKTSSDDKPNLTINGATVTVGTAELTTRAIDIDGDLTVTNGSLTATSTSNSVPTVQVGGNATFTGSTVTITNNSTTQGKSGEYSYAVSTGLYVGGTLDIKNAAKVTSTVIGGNAIYAKGDITISGDNTEVKATNDAYKFSAISTNKTVNISDNSTVKAENLKRHQGDDTGKTDPSTGKTYNACPAITGKIANKNTQNKLHIEGFTTSSPGTSHAKDGVVSNLDIAPSSVEPFILHYDVTITRGDEVVRTPSPVVIAGTTLRNDTYYTITNGSKVAEGTEDNYNAFYDSETKTLKLNNAQISHSFAHEYGGGTDGAIIFKEYKNYCIELSGTNTISSMNTNAINGDTNSLTIKNAAEAENAKLTLTSNWMVICSIGGLNIQSDVTMVNTKEAGYLMYVNDTFSFDGYNAYASVNASGSPLVEYTVPTSGDKDAGYQYLRITKETLETGGGSTHQHTYDQSAWKSDATHHWQECTDPNCPDPTKGITNKAPHSFSNGTCTICGYRGQTEEHHFGTEWISDAEYHWHECTDKGCNAISGKAPHEWTGWRIDEPMGMHNRFCNCGYNDYSHHYNLVYAAAGEAGHYQYCALGNCTFKTSTVPHNYDGDTCTICNYTKSGEIVPPTPDNPGTIVIIRPAEEEKPAQQPNPSTGANDLVGLAVAAAVAAALGSAALLRKHD